MKVSFSTALSFLFFCSWDSILILDTVSKELKPLAHHHIHAPLPTGTRNRVKTETASRKSPFLESGFRMQAELSWLATEFTQLRLKNHLQVSDEDYTSCK
jgi:hypothetical protein